MNVVQKPGATEPPCPQCGAHVPHVSGYVPWCDQCNWNVVPPKQSQQHIPLASFFSRMHSHISHALLSNMLNLSVVRPRVTISKILTFLIAGIVHIMALLFVGIGIFILIIGWPNIIAILGTIMCFGMAWVARPLFTKMPADIVPRETCPATYKMLDIIAEALGTQKVHGIVIGPEFNAAFSHIGTPRKSIVYIGLPLFSILNEQEKVAIAAHELAHGVNGDPLRGVFIGSAINTLVAWSFLLHPDGIWQPGDGTLVGFFTSMLMIPTNMAFIGLSKLTMLVAYVLVYLNFRDSQRAEYLADYLATTVSGTDAMLAALEKLYFQQSIDLVIQRAVLRGNSENLFQEIREHIPGIPQREVERLRRVNLLNDARLDVTHPPTAYRIAFLNQRHVAQAKVKLSADHVKQISDELMLMEDAVRQQFVDAYKQRLYN
jgi:Zn-dependent protease with chaperone function